MLNEALRLIRVFHDLKSVELAEKLGISPSHVSEIEKGKKIPSLDLINKYAEAFHLPVSSIMFFSEDLDERKGIKNRFKAGAQEKLIAFMQAVERFDEKHK